MLDDSELPLARAYSSAVDLHRAGLREVCAAVDAFVGALRRAGGLVVPVASGRRRGVLDIEHAAHAHPHARLPTPCSVL